MNEGDHPALLLLSRKALYSSRVSGNPGRGAPAFVLLGITGIASWSSPVRIRIGVSGVIPFANDPAQYPAPDAEGFCVAISVDAGFLVETLQVDWLACWT